MNASPSIMAPITCFVPNGKDRQRKFFKGQLAAVWRKGSRKCSWRRKRFGHAAIDAYFPKTEIRLLRSAGACGREDDVSAVRSPALHAIDAGMKRQSFGVAAVRRH